MRLCLDETVIIHNNYGGGDNVRLPPQLGLVGNLMLVILKHNDEFPDNPLK